MRPRTVHRIGHQYGGQACYQPSEDKIALPKQEQFRTYETYYATVMHELGHWTDHKTRADRETSLLSTAGVKETTLYEPW